MSSMKAIRIHQTGGPEQLKLEEVATPSPGPGQVRIKHEAIGVNFIDVYKRTGLYPLTLPGGLGEEAAGIVDAVGEGVTRFKPGDHIAYCGGPSGSYAEYNLVDAGKAVLLDAQIPLEIAASAMLKGLTAHYLLRKTFRVEPGSTILFHAAAGGVGQIAVQWAKQLGAKVIGVVGGDDKAKIASALGADQVIISTREDIAKRVREITNGEGVDVVYDSVGKDTFDASLDCLKPLGLMVSFGNASGPPPPLTLQTLSLKGSLFVTRPTLATYIRTTALLDDAAREMFGVIASGAVKIAPPTRYMLADAGQAHRDLEARKTTGSLVLIP